MNLAERVVIVTGASSGIGAATARALGRAAGWFWPHVRLRNWTRSPQNSVWLRSRSPQM